MIDTSAVVDFLLGEGAASEVEALIAREGELAAPDVLVFEVLAVLRRLALRRDLSEARAAGALRDFGDLSVELFPSLPQVGRAWQLRHNLTAADALFLALAEALGEPLATVDSALASAATDHAAIEVTRLGGG